MMSFEEFRENILQEIRVRAGGIFQVKKHDVIKNNNVKQTGIAVVKEEADIGPCVYLDEFYREYESEGMKLGEIADEVYRLILKYEEDTPDVDLSGYRTGTFWIWRWSIMPLPETMHGRTSGRSSSITGIW